MATSAVGTSAFPGASQVQGLRADTEEHGLQGEGGVRPPTVRSLPTLQEIRQRNQRGRRVGALQTDHRSLRGRVRGLAEIFLQECHMKWNVQAKTQGMKISYLTNYGQNFELWTFWVTMVTFTCVIL
jgi:hypothetical protein